MSGTASNFSPFGKIVVLMVATGSIVKLTDVVVNGTQLIPRLVSTTTK